MDAPWNPQVGPAPLPGDERSKVKILADQTGTIYSAWREIYFATYYPQENVK